MINIITDYSFNAALKEITINLPDFISEIERVQKIVNLTTNSVIYDVGSNFNSNFNLPDITCNINKISFSASNQDMQNTDKILIMYDFFFELSDITINDVSNYLVANKYQRTRNYILSDIILSNNTTETQIYSFTIPANSAKQGSQCIAKMFGRFSKNNSSQVILRLKINSVNIFSVTTNTNNLSNIPFEINLISTLRTEGVGGLFQMFKRMKIDNVSNDADIEGLVNFNTTIENLIEITAQWTALNTSNIFTLSQAYTEFI